VERRPWIKRIWHLIGRWGIPKVDLRYTVGAALAGILEKAYHAPFQVIRNVPEIPEDPIIALAHRTKTIVYVGALNEGRALEYVIEAMRDLPEFKLKLIGEGDLSTQLRDLARRHDVTDRVEFTGLMNPDEIAGALSTAMFGLNLLEARSLSYYYSLSNKFFDYIHAGVPSLNMNFPEYRTIIAEYPVGICLDEFSSQSVSDMIRSLASDRERMQSMINACAQARHTFSWENESANLVRMISEI
jgi:glycosyltransferase involved in cell wall biosynthesis